MAERIQKFLAATGLGSRRQVERWIDEGRLKVNGQPAEPGQPVTGDESFQLDGRPLRLPRKPVAHAWLMYNKPEHEVCTEHDPEGRPTVFQALPGRRRRWISVGRLDVNTTGLLLFTTDGQLAHRLMHPSGGVQREYAVRVLGEVGEQALRQLREGVALDDGTARFDSVERGGGDGANTWYRVRLAEGRNREVRRLWEAVGCQVSRLIRTAYGPVELPRSLARGNHRALTDTEVDALYRCVGMQRPEAPTEGQVPAKAKGARGGPRRGARNGRRS